MKLKAFSLLEVLVAILISGIVMGGVYTVYIFSHKQYNKFNEAQTKTRAYYGFVSTINRDFELATQVQALNNYEVEMRLPQQTINYQFNDKAIVRTINFFSDTFYVAVNNVETNIVQSPHASLVDWLKLEVNDNPLSFYKNYGAIAYINE